MNNIYKTILYNNNSYPYFVTEFNKTVSSVSTLSTRVTLIMLRRYTILILLKKFIKNNHWLTSLQKGKADLQIHMELQKAPNSQNNMEKKKIRELKLHFQNSLQI